MNFSIEAGILLGVNHVTAPTDPLLQALWEPQEQTGIKPQLPALACSLGVLVVVLLDGDSLFVTSADQV
jgi:hypothetical protein